MAETHLGMVKIKLSIRIWNKGAISRVYRERSEREKISSE